MVNFEWSRKQIQIMIYSLRNPRAETSCIPRKTETSCIPTKNVYVSLRQIRHYH